MPFHFGTRFDRTISTPDASYTIRLIITDRGALGYGCILAYKVSPHFGYECVWNHCEAVATEGAELAWLGPEACRITFQFDKKLRIPNQRDFHGLGKTGPLVAW